MNCLILVGIVGIIIGREEYLEYQRNKIFIHN